MVMSKILDSFPILSNILDIFQKQSKIQKSVPWIFKYHTLAKVIKGGVEFWEKISDENPKNVG